MKAHIMSDVIGGELHHAHVVVCHVGYSLCDHVIMLLTPVVQHVDADDTVHNEDQASDCVLYQLGRDGFQQAFQPVVPSHLPGVSSHWICCVISTHWILESSSPWINLSSRLSGYICHPVPVDI